MTWTLAVGQQHDCSTCSFRLPCQTRGVGRAPSSLLKGQGRAQMSHLCHNDYMNLMLTEFSQPCGAVQCHFPDLHKALPPRTDLLDSSQREDGQRHFIGETVKAGN